jgi:hypothetical protein
MSHIGSLRCGRIQVKNVRWAICHPHVAKLARCQELRYAQFSNEGRSQPACCEAPTNLGRVVVPAGGNFAVVSVVGRGTAGDRRRLLRRHTVQCPSDEPSSCDRQRWVGDSCFHSRSATDGLRPWKFQLAGILLDVVLPRCFLIFYDRYRFCGSNSGAVAARGAGSAAGFRRSISKIFSFLRSAFPASSNFRNLLLIRALLPPLNGRFARHRNSIRSSQSFQTIRSAATLHINVTAALQRKE